MRRIVLLGLTAVCVAAAQEYTRGIGVYPGDPKEDFGPTLIRDGSTYRNLALHRPAYHSSSYDYNLTAQLITDGIKETALPRWLVAATSEGGVLTKARRELFMDDFDTSTVKLQGAKGWLEFGLEGGDGALEVDRIDVVAHVESSQQQPAGWICIVSGSNDRQTWKELGRAAGTDRPGPSFAPSIAFSEPSHSRYYRVDLEATSASTWQVAEVTPFDRNRQVRMAGPFHFTSAWMSAGSGGEWVYVDLGAACTFDRVALYWIRRPTDGAIQTSDDARTWRTLRVLPAAAGPTDDLKLERPEHGRYVRVIMTKAASPEGYILSEMEVYGRGGPVAKPKPAPAGQSGRLTLAGGAWRLQRDSLVKAGGEAISKPGFQDKDWIIATVPGTVLTSYLNVGAVPNPDFGDNQLQISDSFFYADFWYRDEFTAPSVAEGERAWLNFDGINWKADVFLNGGKVGRIEGGFMRGRFDVTNLIHPGAKNTLAVRIEKPASPGSVKAKGAGPSTGGALGADNPTYHASAGWDWMPTIRGRNMGIWADVYLTRSGPVTIENPLVTTSLPLPDTSRADIAIEATLHNQETKPVSGTLHARFGPATVEIPVALDASAAKTVRLDPSTSPALRLANPKLWWPNGYGDPNLYPVELTFITADHAVSDVKSFQAGIRQFTYSEEGNSLRIWINGRRFIARGGNWGFPESMLRYRAREYDAAVRYERDEHFNIISVWLGQTADEAFYGACDRYGIVVWQDFWLANPVDGPDPADNDFFLRGAKDYILKIRNHASIGLYCGRNEGLPPKPLDDGLRSLIAGLHPGLHYIPSSADDNTVGTGTYVVTGHGPYRNEPLRYYFAHPPAKLHSEMGSPNVVTMDSLRLIMPESAMWPQGDIWTMHDFNPRGPFSIAIAQSYGAADNIADWLSLAQFVDYDAYRGMFEGQSRNRMGVMLWMSHCAWPDIDWQTYDYFLDPDAGYFGAKKGAEPLHILWNAATDTVEVVNYSAGDVVGLSAHAEILNMDGSLQWEKTAALDSAEDSTVAPFKLEYAQGLSPVHFIRLTLTRGSEALSSNFYLRGAKQDDYTAIRGLAKAKVAASTKVERQGAKWLLTTELRNISRQPALMVHLKVVREKSRDRILPALYSDNYVALMPGERKTIQTELKHMDTRGERPRMVVEGFNAEEAPAGRGGLRDSQGDLLK
jgi:hypothetical protein